MPRVFGVFAARHAVLMIGTNSWTKALVELCCYLGDVGSYHPGFPEKLVLFSFDAGPESIGATIELCQRQIIPFEEPRHLRFAPVSANAWPLKQDRDGAGALTVKSEQLTEKPVEQLMVLGEEPSARWVFAVRDLPR